MNDSFTGNEIDSIEVSINDIRNINEKLLERKYLIIINNQKDTLITDYKKVINKQKETINTQKDLINTYETDLENLEKKNIKKTNWIIGLSGGLIISILSSILIGISK